MKQVLCALALVASAGSSPAFAWGCDGHQAIALLAERLLSPSVVAAMRTVLADSPISPDIKPYCPLVPDDPIANAATWADDNRTVHPETGSWHFIDIPLTLGADIGDYRRFCPNGNCVVDAIVAQYRILTTTTDRTLKGNALRYVIHFIGDIHQPLHTTTNGDRGGNCLPVTDFGLAPKEDDNHNFSPNLHSVWDGGTIRRVMVSQYLNDSRALADYVAGQETLGSLPAQAPTTAVVVSWAKGVNALARQVTYGKLPVRVPMEPAEAFSLATCAESNQVGRRMAALTERIDATYEQASVPAILSELRLAAERLASVLMAAFPEVGRRP